MGTMEVPEVDVGGVQGSHSGNPAAGRPPCPWSFVTEVLGVPPPCEYHAGQS
jgi:hypothetical protein